MRDRSLWRIFAVVFVAAFVANTIVAYAWNIFFHDSGWRWDTATVTAAVVGLVVAYILRKKKH